MPFYFRTILPILLLVLCNYQATADTFIVTSKADSGPGTLRDAINQAAANGTATTDYIYFNLPDLSQSGRMIDLADELPALSSNLVIDGTTQPGNPFAVTDAKIFIRKMDYAPAFSMLKIQNVTDVKIYGLYLFWQYYLFAFGGPLLTGPVAAINLANAFNIEIGAPGKGNVINGWRLGIYAATTNDACGHISIRSNFIGQGMYYDHAADDVSDVIITMPSCIQLANVMDCTIGGPTAADGNTISGNRSLDINSKYASGNGALIVQNNHFCRWYDKQKLMAYVDLYNFNVNIGNSHYIIYPTSVPANDYAVQVLDNDIPTQLSLSNTTAAFVIQRNHFDADPSTKYTDNKLSVSQCTGGGVIGGEDEANANYFRYRKTSVPYNSESVFIGSNRITYLKNVFECNTTLGSTTKVPSSPFAQIDQTTGSSVNGTATPKCRIDLYYDDECAACEGKIYIGQTTSDADGNWLYSGPVNGTVIATATDANGWTGEFSTPRLYTTNVKVIMPSCGQANGKISGITSDGAETFYWKNLTTGAIVGNAIDLENAGPGEYLLYGVHGGTCTKSLYGSIELGDRTPRILTNNVSVTQPSCGKFNGVITNFALTESFDVKFTWVNDQGKEISNQSWLSNVGPGQYKLMIKDTVTGCSDETAYYELINQSGPSIDINQAAITGTTCRQPTGSITNIVISDITGQPSYNWKDAAGKTVATTADLLNAFPGIYHLEFKDQGGCDLITTPDFEIPNQGGDLSLQADKHTITPETCEQKNGSVLIEHIAPSDIGFSFSWIDSSTQQIVGDGMTIGGLPAGTYYLQAMDENGCKQRVETFRLVDLPAPRIDLTTAIISPDLCSQLIGAVSGLSIQGSGPFNYAWYNADKERISSEKDLTGVGQGAYSLMVTDNNHCTAITTAIAVTNAVQVLAAPQYLAPVVIKGNPASLSVQVQEAGVYGLYASTADGPAIAPSAQNSTGDFTTVSLLGDTTVYIRYSKGDCNSPYTRIDIKVLLTTELLLPNAFTPNNDGHNDFFRVRNPALVGVFSMAVFNRFGQKVFETTDPYRGWDGNMNGQPVPAGTYVWTIQYTDILGGSVNRKGTVVLIR